MSDDKVRVITFGYPGNASEVVLEFDRDQWEAMSPDERTAAVDERYLARLDRVRRARGVW